MRNYLFIAFPLLLTWGFVVGTFLPWFEYRTTWDPPKGAELALRGKKTVTYEQLRFYDLGPELYPVLENLDSTGCYLTGVSFLSIHPWNPPPDIPLRPPYRLHVSNLTGFQTYHLRFMRPMALLLFGINSILNLIFGGISGAKFMRRLISRRPPWYQYLFPLAAFAVLAALSLTGLLLFLGPLVGSPTAVDPLPGWRTCQTEPSYTPPATAYDLAQWELNRILYEGPALMIPGVGLTIAAAVAWLNSQK